MQFSLTPVRIGVSFLSLSVFYMLSAPVAGKLADKIVIKIIIAHSQALTIFT